jgi:hypothetical protein
VSRSDDCDVGDPRVIRLGLAGELARGNFVALHLFVWACTLGMLGLYLEILTILYPLAFSVFKSELFRYSAESPLVEAGAKGDALEVEAGRPVERQVEARGLAAAADDRGSMVRCLCFVETFIIGGTCGVTVATSMTISSG